MDIANNLHHLGGEVDAVSGQTTMRHQKITGNTVANTLSQFWRLPHKYRVEVQLRHSIFVDPQFEWNAIILAGDGRSYNGYGHLQTLAIQQAVNEFVLYGLARVQVDAVPGPTEEINNGKVQKETYCD